MAQVVLITGVSRYLGGRLAAQLAGDPRIDRVIGVDTVPPRTEDLALLGRTEFVRADIRNPLIARVIAQARISTVVHAALVPFGRAAGGRASMQDMNVIGTMQLLAACQKSDDVDRVVLKSTTAVYGCGPRDPAVFTETMALVEGVTAGLAKDAVEVEAYVRGFARRRPDIDVSILRLADVVGPTADSVLARYLRGPIVPTIAGYDPRLQVLHESDAIETLRLATVSARPGTYNVAADGVAPLSQAIRRAGQARVTVPGRALGVAAALVRNDAASELDPGWTNYLRFGRVVDTTALHTRFGYTPQFTTADALAAVRGRQAPLPHVARLGIGVGSRMLQTRRDGRVVAPGR